MKCLPVTEEDLPEIARVESESFSDPWSQAMLREELTNSDFVFLKLSEGESLAAYAGFWVIAGEEAHIGTVCVCKAYRGRGYGNALIEHLIAEAAARGLTSLTLEVRESNSVALSLYRKHGFVSCGVRPGYYANGENAVIMWLTLTC